MIQVQHQATTSGGLNVTSGQLIAQQHQLGPRQSETKHAMELASVKQELVHNQEQVRLLMEQQKKTVAAIG